MSQVIRKCEKEDIPLLLELFKTVYPSNPRLQDSGYFDWHFKNTPFCEDEGYTFWLLWEDTSIKGFLGYVPLQFRYGEEIFKGCWTHNWFSSDQGIAGIKLLIKLMGDYENRFLLGLSSNSEYICKMYQIPILEKMPRWITVLDPGKAFDIFGVKNCSDQKKIQHCYEHLILNNDVQGILPCTRFDPDEEFRMDHWSEIKGYCRRTGKYLNWRYLDIPNHNYRAIRGGQSQFAIYRIEKIKGFEESVTRILEWNFTGTRGQNALATIIEDSMNQGSILIDFFCTADKIGDEFVQLSFIPIDSLTSPIPYLFRPIHYAEGIQIAIDLPPHRIEKDFNFSEWYITKGDSDIDRIKL